MCVFVRGYPTMLLYVASIAIPLYIFTKRKKKTFICTPPSASLRLTYYDWIAQTYVCDRPLSVWKNGQVSLHKNSNQSFMYISIEVICLLGAFYFRQFALPLFHGMSSAQDERYQVDDAYQYWHMVSHPCHEKCMRLREAKTIDR